MGISAGWRIDGGGSGALAKSDSIAKEAETIAVSARLEPRPVGMLPGQGMSLRVGHEAQDPARTVAESRHVGRGPVGIVVLAFPRSRCVAQDQLPRAFQPLQRGGIATQESALAVRHGDDPGTVADEEGTGLGVLGTQGHPAVDEGAAAVSRQRGRDLPLVVGWNEQAGLEKHLEAIADAEDQLAGVAEAREVVVEEVAKLIGQDFAGRHVVAIGEAAGDDENLEVVQEGGVLAEAIDVEAVRRAAGLFEGESRFLIAIRARRSKDEHAHRGHGSLQEYPVRLGENHWGHYRGAPEVPMSQPRRRLPWWKKLAFAAMIVLGLPLLLEGGARVVHGWNRHWLDCHRPHPTLGWVLREGWAGKWSWTGGFARINGQGLRMDEDLGPKAAGERRLLCVGDSVTFGANVKTGETFPSQLQHRLRARGTAWRVLNGGVTSYDPAQEQEWLEAFGWRLEPDALIVTFCRNDVCPSRRQVSDAHRSAAGKAGEWLSEHSLIFFKLERLAVRARAGWAGSSGQQQMVVDSYAPLTGFPYVEQAYRRLAASARAHGVPVSLAIVPTLETLSGSKSDDLTAQLTVLGQELGWRVIDLAPAMMPVEASLFLPNDPVHPSAAGYARIADYLARRVVD